MYDTYKIQIKHKSTIRFFKLFFFTRFIHSNFQLQHQLLQRIKNEKSGIGEFKELIIANYFLDISRVLPTDVDVLNQLLLHLEWHMLI